MKLGTIILLIVSAGYLGGCTSDTADIKEWMDGEKKRAKGKVKEIPDAKGFQPISFISVDDPFKEKTKTNIEDLEKNKYAPDPNRRKEPLELYQVEQLKITGFIAKDGIMYAMVRTPENKITYISKGNYMGINYGKVIEVQEGVIKIEERVKDTDTWKIKVNEIKMY